MTGTERAIRFYQRMEARDWEALGPLLADDVVYEMPQTRERIVGRQRYLDWNIGYPGDWHLKVHSVVDSGELEVAVRIAATADGEDLDNVAFITFDEQGLVTLIVDFWPQAYEPPPGRPAFVTRY